MSVTVAEIVLLIISAIVFVVTFLIPDSREKGSGVDEEAARKEIQDLVSQEMDAIRGHVEEVGEESMTYAMEKTERALERLSNEKIMAVNEYSDTVMKEIHKSHEEVMFLYDMLNSKHENLKKAASEAGRAAKELQDAVEKYQRMQAPVAKADGNAVPASGDSGNLSGTGSGPSSGANGKQETASPRRQPKVAREKEPVGGGPLLKGMLSKKAEDLRRDLDLGETAVLEQELPPLADGIAEVQLDADASRNNNEQILELHKKGKSNVAIARELGLGVGEVKLVIDLYKNL